MSEVGEQVKGGMDIDHWLDLMVRVDIESKQQHLDSKRMLALVQEIWGDSIETVEYKMLDRIFSTTERLIEGNMTESEWVNQMNRCFREIWTEDAEKEM